MATYNQSIQIAMSYSVGSCSSIFFLLNKSPDFPKYDSSPCINLFYCLPNSTA